MNNQDFGKFISTLRKEKGLTQKEFAEKLNLTDKAISCWENGKNYPDIEMFEALGNELGVTISELVACKRLETREEAEKETAIKYIEEVNKKYRLIGIIKLIIYVIASVLIEAGIGYLILNIVSSIIQDTYANSKYYLINIISLSVASLIISIVNFGIILPSITNRNNRKAKDVYYILMFSFIIIGAVQIIYASYNGAGALGLLLNSLNAYPIIVFCTTENFADIIKFATLFIIGCLCKPICFMIGNKIKAHH